MTVSNKLFCSALSMRELLLLICTQPLLVYGLDAIYRTLVPRPIYPYEYSYYSIILRLVFYLAVLIFVSVLMYGVWRLVRKTEESLLLKWIAYLEFLVNIVMILFGFGFTVLELINIDPQNFPYGLKQLN